MKRRIVKPARVGGEAVESYPMTMATYMIPGLEQMIFQDVRADHPLALSSELSQRGTEVVANRSLPD